MDTATRAWQQLGISGAPGVVADVETQYRAFSSGALLVPLPDWERLLLGGEDRIEFLHGQVANDVRALAIGGVGDTLLLNHRGHALAQMRVLRFESQIVALVEEGAAEQVEASLRAHIIFDQVELARAPEDALVLTLQGPEAPRVVQGLDLPMPTRGRFESGKVAGGEVTVVPATRSPAGGVDLIVAHEVAAALIGKLQASGVTPGSEAGLDLARVCAGIATAGREGGEGILPQEAGLGELISYRKGCYLGQEIMARIEARGSLRRALGGLSLDQQPPPGRPDIVQGGRKVGRLGTVAQHPRLGLVALAVLRNDLPDDAELVVGDAVASKLELPLPH